MTTSLPKKASTSFHNVTLFALGANAAARRAGNHRRIVAAAAALRAAFGRGLRLSPVYASPAWPPGIGPDFVNAVAMLPRRLPPRSVLDRLHRIEAGAGRRRDRRWGPRAIDLDLVAVGTAIRPDRATLRHWMRLPPARQGRETPDRLILPHPRMQDRAFVLRPLCDLRPDWRHPLTGRSAAALHRALPRAATAGLVRLAPTVPRKALSRRRTARK